MLEINPLRGHLCASTIDSSYILQGHTIYDHRLYTYTCIHMYRCNDQSEPGYLEISSQLLAIKPHQNYLESTDLCTRVL